MSDPELAGSGSMHFGGFAFMDQTGGMVDVHAEVQGGDGSKQELALKHEATVALNPALGTIAALSISYRNPAGGPFTQQLISGRSAASKDEIIQIQCMAGTDPTTGNVDVTCT